MRVDLFDFELPPERIALRPVRPRDAARMLVVEGDKPFADHTVSDLPALLRAGDVLPISAAHPGNAASAVRRRPLAHELRMPLTHDWEIGVLYGPHGAPDFFTPEDIAAFFATDWEVHYNSSRTGVRLIGPKPQWARSDGGEAGLHPSNIHDNAYAIGAVDFTGDMPVILGPDGPSLGGFVCPVTIVQAELWKMGQLKPGDRVRFRPLTRDQARAMLLAQERDGGDAPTRLAG